MIPFKNSIKILGILILLLNAFGCRDITTHTKVNSDGSCERILIVEGDSTEIINYAYPIPSDSTWNAEETGSNEMTLSKSFKRVSDLNKHLASAPDSALKIEVALNKRFRWFYTYIRYQEVYKPFNKFSHIPLTDYLTEAEIDSFHLGEGDSEIEDKVESWYLDNMKEEVYEALFRSARAMNNPLLTIELIQEKKTALFSAFDEEDFDSDTKSELVNSVLEACEKVYGTRTVWKLEKNLSELVQTTWEKYYFTMYVGTEDYENIVTMPGLILDTNSEEIDGNNVTWDIEWQNFLYKDYEMWAESRIVNKWAIVITGIILLIIIIGLLTAVIRRRKNFQLD